MRRIEIVRAARGSDFDARARGPRRIAGDATRAAASPDDASIWMDVIELAPGAALAWEASHGEEALFVERGEVVVDGRVCGAGGAIVVERRSPAKLEARSASRLVAMGSHHDGLGARAADDACEAVHVIGPRGVWEALEPGRETRFFADATCPTCRVWLLFTARSFAYESPIHSHSQDELIHVLRGEIRVGSLALGPGDTVFIAADQVYRFKAGDAGFAFLNFRADASLMSMRETGKTIVENGAATGMARVAQAMTAGVE